MSLTYNQAIEELAKIPATKEALLELASKVSTTVPGTVSGDVTYLFSGMIDSNTKTSEITNKLLDVENARIINNTDAFDFLKSRDFLSKLAEATGENVDDLMDSKYSSPTTEWLNGSTDSPWAAISKNFVAEATGDIHTFTPNADISRIFGATELTQALSETSKVTSINGIPIEALREMSFDNAFNAVNAMSEIEMASLKFGYDADGKLVQVGTADYFKNIGLSEAGISLSNDVTVVEGSKVLSDYNQSLSPEVYTQKLEAQKTALSQLSQTQEAISRDYKAAELAGDVDGMAKAGKVLNKLGVVGTVLGIGIMANEAQAAYASGDSTKARQIIEKFAA